VDEEVGGFSVVGVSDIIVIGEFSILFVIIVVVVTVVVTVVRVGPKIEILKAVSAA
jgi:hypothetical protein